MLSSRPGRLAVVVAGVSTVVVFGAVVLVTGFLACGVSGCSGAGFGPSFSPVAAQAGLLLAGLSLVPFTLVCVSGRSSRWWPVVAAALAVAGGSLVAMLLLGLGADGCPAGRSRATASSEAFSPGSPTCSGDPEALAPSASA